MRDRRWFVVFGAALTIAACSSSKSTSADGGAGASGNGSDAASGRGGSGGATGVAGATGSGGAAGATGVAGVAGVAGAGGAAGSGGAAGATGSAGAAGAGGVSGAGGMAGSGTAGAAGQGGGATANCALSRAFGTPVQVVASTATSSEDGASVGADGLTAIVSVRPNQNINVHQLSIVSRSTLAGTFGNPQDVPGETGAWSGTEPRLTRDGLSLFFDSFTPSQITIERVTRASVTDPFASPSFLPATINSATDSTYGPWISSDNGRFYFERNHVLYVSTITAGQFGAPVAVTELNTGTVLDAVLTDDELTIYFASERQVDPTVPSNYFRIWMSTRGSKASAWAPPSFVSELDNGDDMVPTDVSPDGCILYVVDTDRQSVGRVKQAAKPSL